GPIGACDAQEGADVRVPRGTGGLAALLVLTLAGGYAVGDLYDLLPGRFTLAPVPADPDPFPTAPGATGATELATALDQLSDAAPAPDPQSVAELVTELVEHEWLGGADGVSVLVTDVTTGAVLGAHRETQARVPASTVKRLTALAVLDSLGTEATLPTSVERIAADRIVLVGGGDMMLSPGAGNPDAVMGRAGLGDLARVTASQLRLAGQTEVRLDFDASLFSGAELHPTWENSYLNGGYGAPITPLAVDLGARRTEVPYPPRFPVPARNASGVVRAAPCRGHRVHARALRDHRRGGARAARGDRHGPPRQLRRRGPGDAQRRRRRRDRPERAARRRRLGTRRLGGRAPHRARRAAHP